jgi:uracil-DNA glycosylase family 4
MTDGLTAADFAAFLDFHVAAGVDCALEEEPQNRFAAPERPDLAAEPRRAAPAAAAAAPTPPPVAARPAPGKTTVSPDEAALSARELAARAGTLEELEAALMGFEGCALRVTAKNLVFHDGTPGARVMLVGEAPGADEDRIGKPFMGRSGQLLDKMLAAIGLDRSSVYIANVVPWRPPGNRTPTPQEVAICKPFIERQIALARPEFLICLGGPAMQTLLGVKDGILKSRGRWSIYDAGGRQVKALATLHPAYLLRQPLQKRLGWRDFRALRKALDETGPPPQEPGGA